jgi:hypothetical protein
MSASIEQRKLAAIMFTNMVGYSALSQRDDEIALKLLEEHREILRKIFPEFNGNQNHRRRFSGRVLQHFHSAIIETARSDFGRSDVGRKMQSK